MTPLAIAVNRGHAGIVEQLLAAGANPNIKLSSGSPPLAVAAAKGHAGIVEQLLAAGANPNIELSSRSTPLSIAAVRGHAGIVEQLLAAGANPNIKLSSGSTPLAEAADKGDAGIVEQLLAAGANPNIKSKSPYEITSLIRAAQNGHAGVVEQLLAAGANPDIKSADGFKALELAAENGHAGVVDKLKAITDQHGHTFLHAATIKKEAVYLERFLNTFGKRCGMKTKNGNTIFHLAVVGNDEKIIRTILDNPNCRYIDLNAKNQAGKTALDLVKTTPELRSYIEEKAALQTWKGWAKAIPGTAIRYAALTKKPPSRGR